jgi:hypothetical protein
LRVQVDSRAFLPITTMPPLVVNQASTQVYNTVRTVIRLYNSVILSYYEDNMAIYSFVVV